MMFKNAIVRKVSRNFENGITSSTLGKPLYEKALLQHSEYIEKLKKCGLQLRILEADDKFPDSTFVEDTVVVNEDCAIITNLGAPSRKGEEKDIKKVMEEFYSNLESIQKPGTLEGGDVLRIEDHYFIGLSKRTNKAGANQLANILKKYGYSSTMVKLLKFLHLKTGVAYIGDNNLITAGEFIKASIFKDFNTIQVDKDESYATNCIRINNFILIAKGFERLKTLILERGFEILEIEMSEFRKMDGGLSCLSIRF